MHFALLLPFLWYTAWHPQVDVTPIDLLEFKRALSERGSPAKQNPSSRRLPPSKSPVNPLAAPSSSASSAPAGNPNQGFLGELVEDFEASELPVLLNEVRVPYPPEARARKIQGPVVFDLILTSEGQVHSLTLITSPDPILSRAAEEAVRRFRFKPARLRDKAVAIQIRYTYRFTLE